MKSIKEAYQEASSLLDAQNEQIDSAISQNSQQVCEWLLMHILEMDRAQLYMRWDDQFPAKKWANWEQAIERKLAGEPVQYIIGEQEFYGRPFDVDEHVLIPRPETELLVEAIINKVKQLWPNGSVQDSAESNAEGSLTVADIGTGSGCIPITIAAEMPGIAAMPAWQLYASDISAAALKVAKRNAARHEVAARIAFCEGDLLVPFIEAGIQLDVIISNPPYIPSPDIVQLQKEVQHYEPSLALDGGKDGLELYRRLIGQLAQLPRYPRVIGLEVGAGQARQVARMLEACKQWSNIDIVRDLARIERHVIASD